MRFPSKKQKPCGNAAGGKNRQFADAGRHALAAGFYKMRYGIVKPFIKKISKNSCDH